MADSNDFICDICGEFTSLQDNGLQLILYAEQPGDRVGTSYDMSQLHPFMAYLSAMRIPRFSACELCLFHGTPATDDAGNKTRTGPPIMTADVTHPALLNYFARHGASIKYPGLTQQQEPRADAEAAKAATALKQALP